MDDILETLFAAIDAVPDAPDMELMGPAEIGKCGTALQIAVTRLLERAALFNQNARVALPNWELPHES